MSPTPASLARNPSSLARAHQKLAELVYKRRAADAFVLATQMKKEGIQPDVVTYEYLLDACRDAALSTEAQIVFEDCIAMGIRPTRNMFHLMLQVR